MKKISLAIAGLIGSASAAIAGGMAAPVAIIEPVEETIMMDPSIVQNTTASTGSGGFLIIPLILIALIAAVASGRI